MVKLWIIFLIFQTSNLKKHKTLNFASFFGFIASYYSIAIHTILHLVAMTHDSRKTLIVLNWITPRRNLTCLCPLYFWHLSSLFALTSFYTALGVNKGFIFREWRTDYRGINLGNCMREKLPKDNYDWGQWKQMMLQQKCRFELQCVEHTVMPVSQRNFDIIIFP